MKFRLLHRAAWIALTILCIEPILGQTLVDPRELPAFESGSSLVGTVVDSDGKPVGAAEVYLLPNPEGAFTLPVKPQHTPTNQQGGFEFSDLQDGGYQIWAETLTHTSLVQKLRGRKVEIRAATTTSNSLVIPLHAGCGYDVAVYDPHGKPVEAATISFGWTDINRQYTTGRDGIARIRNVSIDDWYFVVTAEGYATQFFKTSKQNLGSLLPVKFDLQPGGEIVGVLKDEEGLPVKGARVVVSSADLSMAPNYARVLSDAQGEFVVKGLPLGQQLRVSADMDNYIDVRTTVAIVGTKEPTVLELTLARRPYGGDIRVSVVDEQGQPINNATLSNRGNSSADVRTAKTDATGFALLQDVFSSYAGHLVCAKAQGYVAQQQSAEVGTVDAPGEVVFKLAKGNTLRGRVLSPEGQPLSKLKVYYNSGENGDPLGGRVETDSDGRFEIDGLGPRALITVYTPPIYAPIRKIDVRTDLDELMEMTLVPAGVLLVRAVDAVSGNPIGAYNVRIGRCESPQPGDLSPGGIATTLMDSGINIQGDTKEYRLENQVIGTVYKVMVSAAGYETTTVDRMLTQEIAAAKTVDVPLMKLRTENYQIVAGRLIDADGNPIVGAAVRLLVGRAIPRVNPVGVGNPMGGWKFYHWGLLSRDDIEGRDQCEQLFKTVSDQEGKFRIEGVKRDMPWMELFYFGEGIFAQRYSNLSDLSEPELQALQLQAERPASLQVRVDRKAHPDAARVSLDAQDSINGFNAIKLPYASTYQSVERINTFQPLPAGTYSLALQSKPIPTGGGGYTVKSIAHQIITLEPGQQLTIEF